MPDDQAPDTTPPTTPPAAPTDPAADVMGPIRITQADRDAVSGDTAGEDPPEPPDGKPPADTTAPDRSATDRERFAKLAARGRDVARRRFALRDEQAAVQSRQAQLSERHAELDAREKSLQDAMSAFERDPIEAYRSRGADPKKVAERMRDLLANKASVRAGDDIDGLRKELSELREAIGEQNKVADQQRQKAAHRAAIDEFSSFSSTPESQRAYPLMARLPTERRAALAVEAASKMIANGHDGDYADVCAVVEDYLTEIRDLVGSGQQQSGEQPAKESNGSSNGQRVAPSIGNEIKGAAPAVDWDRLNLPGNEREFIRALRAEVSTSR